MERNIYFGSDWHFSRFRKTTRSMKYDYNRSKDILNKYQKMVDKNDVFILLGDLSYIGKKNTQGINECLEKIRQLPGKKILVKGNHDQSLDRKYKELGFKIVSSKIELSSFTLTHAPIDIPRNKINIHGHLHGAYNYYECSPYNHVDAFTGMFRNYPIRFEELLLTSDFIEVGLVNDKMINDFKQEIFKLVD